MKLKDKVPKENDPFRLTDYNILRTVLIEVLIDKRPLDPVLNGLMRAKKSLRGPQRQQFYDVILGVFRWWGVLRDLLHPDDLWFIESAEPMTVEQLKISDRSAAALLLGALLLDNISLPSFYQSWSKLVGVNANRMPNRFEYTNYLKYAEAVFGRISAALEYRKPSKHIEFSDLIPEWCVNYLSPDVEIGKIADWVKRRPPIWLRAQCADVETLLRELKAQNVRAESHQRLPNALRIDRTIVNLYTLPQFKNGMFEIQDLGSQSIALTCAPKPGERWWEPCAGAGGKTLALAAQMRNKGTVIAGDIRGYKLDDLRKRARRAGFSNIQCKEWDGKPMRKKQQGKFDGVLVDAPCSCSGTWRRNPDAKWTTDPAEIETLSNLQLEILTAAATGVRPGGTLVYATCSLFVEENEEVIQAFLAQESSFELEPFIAPITGETCDGMLHVYPWDGDNDAMFMARMRRRV